MSYYVIGNNKCLYEGMTKEEILAAITQAVETHEITDVDTGFVTKLKEYNRNVQVTYWIGTQNEYDALQSIEPNRLYFISDDTFGADVAAAIANANASIESMSNTLSNIQTATVTSDWAYEHVDSGTLTFYKNGSLVICDVDIIFDTASESFQNRTLLNYNTIPQGFRPRENVSANAALYIYRSSSTFSNNLSDTGRVKISSDGIILSYNIGVDGANVHGVGQICYFA